MKENDIVQEALQWLNKPNVQGGISLTATERHELVIILMSIVDEGIVRPRNLKTIQQYLRRFMDGDISTSEEL